MIFNDTHVIMKMNNFLILMAEDLLLFDRKFQCKIEHLEFSFTFCLHTVIYVEGPVYWNETKKLNLL